MTIAALIRALRQPKAPNPIPRRHRFLRRLDRVYRRYDTTTRQGRRAAAFAGYYAYATPERFENSRKERRAIARDLAKTKLRGKR